MNHSHHSHEHNHHGDGYKIQLIKKELVAEGTFAFYFEKPENFVFGAGQHGHFTFINPPETDAEGNTREFSFITPPHEEYLGIATRMRDSAFKRVLGKMEPGVKGSELVLTEPMGNFILHENPKRPAIFIAGGIGITPFMSIIKDAIHRKLSHTIFLFYSNHRPQDAPFLTELNDLDTKGNGFSLIATMTDAENSKKSWRGETGHIDLAKIEKHIPDRMNAMYYIAGPEKMVKGMRDMLRAAGVSNDDIKTEEFTRY